MLAIRVELLHGTIRAGSPDDVALTGQEDPGEWPPSPARLFSALVSADGTGSVCRVTDGSELAVLESAGPPVIEADPKAEVLFTPIHPRFVVADERSQGSVHEYVARTSSQVRPSTRISPATSEVSYVWPDLDATSATVEALKRRAARVGYLGCADSPVRVTVHENAEPPLEARSWRPMDSGSHPIPVPYPGFTKVLDAAFELWTTRPVRRSWLRTERVRYAAPGESERPDASPEVFWLRFKGSVAYRQVLDVTESLRASVLDLYQRELPTDEAPPPVLHGHGFLGRGYHHAQWLALPDVGFPYSTGRIHGAAVWLPPGTDPEVISALRFVLGSLNELSRPGRLRVAVKPYGGERRPLAAAPVRWRHPSRRWVSAFSVIHERWRADGPDEAEIERWLAHAGAPCHVSAFTTSSVPLLQGSQRLRAEEIHRAGRDRHPFSFVELELDREIAGPLVIGRGRQFGLGLMLPVNGGVDD